MPVLVKSTRSSRAGVRASSASARSPGSAVTPSCTEPGVSSSSASIERGADARVVAADVVHPEAAEHVEVAVAVGVVEVGAVGARPGAVEADRAQDAHELRVDRARPALVLVAGAGEEAL